MASFNHYHQELKRIIDALPEQFEQLETAVDRLRAARQIITTGVGKSGYIAMKMAASLASIGRQASFLDPVGAVHGDLGVVQEGATVIIFSKSGSSSELEQLIPYFKKRKCDLIGICNRAASTLGKHANLFLDLRMRHEGEPLNTLPMISTDISLILANLLTARLIERDGVTMDRIVYNHPAGQIGRNIGLQLKDIKGWSERRPFVTPDTSLVDAIVIDSEHRAGLVCVVDDVHRLLGLVTDGDIRKALKENLDLRATRMDAIWNTQPVILDADLSVGDALSVMENERRKVFSAPVVEEGICTGVVTLHDLISS